MLHLPFRFALLLTLAASCLSQSQYQWPSPQYDALEGLLYEGRRPDGSSLASIVNPCRYRLSTNASIGAEWLRFVSIPSLGVFALTLFYAGFSRHDHA
jgi:hypothetical protein